MRRSFRFKLKVLRTIVAAMAGEQQPCIVSIAEGLSQFEVPFVDSVSRTISTRTLFLNEPVIYQPSHLPSPVLTHIVFVGKDHFMVGASVTERMIPRSQAQRVRITCKNRIAINRVGGIIADLIGQNPKMAGVGGWLHGNFC